MNMAGPPPGEFASREELMEFMKEWAAEQGFAVVIGRSRPNKLWIKCDRGGKYSERPGAINPNARKRKRVESRLMECPFKVQANVKKDGIWRSRTEIADHNHGPSEDMSVHPSLRRMTEDQLQKVKQMTEAGNTPIETLTELTRLWPNIKVLRRDIYNARKKHKIELELANIAQGLHLPQPYQDPNGIMPGPTRTGHWEWLEDGDEIKRKRRKKASLLTQENIAPELRSNGTQQGQQPMAQHQAPTLNDMSPNHFPPTSTHQPQIMATLRTQQPNDISSPQNAYGTNQISSSGPFSPPATSEPSSEELGPNSVHHSINPAVELAAAANGTGSGDPKSPSSQILASEVERLDKELKDQKSLLAKILVAVQGGNGRQQASN